MMILDTNVLSELIKPVPSSSVISFIGEQDGSDLYLTIITQAELLYGVQLMPEGQRRRIVNDAVSQMFEYDFTGRILPFEEKAAYAYAEIAASRRKAGKPITQPDAQIAAIARTTSATIITRNHPDFTECGIEIINPWLD